ncbi:MAG TPA: shikimate kinase [Clostridiaceae bacterium]|nr:shikimate kinase [Clostridiaceae bacterium]
MKNLVLIGMPASGKSTIGVLLAKTLGMDFIDTDLLIQKSEGALLQDIIINKGIDRFIQIEQEIITKLNCTNCVIATGGSAVYGEKAMEHLKLNGIVVYLEASYEEIKRRLTNIKSRGIVFVKGQDLFSLYNERMPLYQKYADISINCDGKSIEDIVSLIKDEIKNHG